MPRSSSARARLVASAARLMHAGSYATASVEDLCADARVQKGSFYYFFPSKRDLAVAAVDQQWADARATILDPAFAPDVAPLERLARFFRSVADRQRGEVVRGCPFGNLVGELGTLDDVIRAKVAQVFDGYLGYFEQALREAAVNGELQDADVPGVAQAFLAYFQGALLLAKTRNDSRIIDALAAHALNLAAAPRPVISSQQRRQERAELQSDQPQRRRGVASGPRRRAPRAVNANQA